MRRELNYIDLFSGIGGFALGAQWAGMKWKHHYHSDIDEYANKVYAKHFPGAIQLGDIVKIKTEDLPNDDYIITGGFPCQDISIAGKGAGLAGTRSSLWFEYWRLIRDIRPKFAIMENVGAITFRGLDRVLGSLAEIGYSAEWQDIRASDMGAPHRRERIWIIAYAEGERVWDMAMEREQDSKNINIEWNSEKISDTKCKGLHEEYESETRQITRCFGEQQSYWAVEPNVGRLAHGIPYRVDRLKCLGNSIVPQIAKILFERIKCILENE